MKLSLLVVFVVADSACSCKVTSKGLGEFTKVKGTIFVLRPESNQRISFFVRFVLFTIEKKKQIKELKVVSSLDKGGGKKKERKKKKEKTRCEILRDNESSLKTIGLCSPTRQTFSNDALYES